MICSPQESWSSLSPYRYLWVNPDQRVCGQEPADSHWNNDSISLLYLRFICTKSLLMMASVLCFGKLCPLHFYLDEDLRFVRLGSGVGDRHLRGGKLVCLKYKAGARSRVSALRRGSVALLQMPSLTPSTHTRAHLYTRGLAFRLAPAYTHHRPRGVCIPRIPPYTYWSHRRNSKLSQPWDLESWQYVCVSSEPSRQTPLPE